MIDKSFENSKKKENLKEKKFAEETNTKYEEGNFLYYFSIQAKTFLFIEVLLSVKKHSSY